MKHYSDRTVIDICVNEEYNRCVRELTSEKPLRVGNTPIFFVHYSGRGNRGNLPRAVWKGVTSRL